MPTAPYILPGEEEDKRLKVAGYACTVLENDVFEYPAEKPFGYMTEALDDLKPNEIYIVFQNGPRCSWRRSGRLHPRYPQGHRAELPCFLLRYMGTGFLRPYLRVQVALPH